MKLSEKWLREWVNPAIDTQTLADQLTMAGLEIESLTQPAGTFNHVIIGKIQHAEQHPKADRLRVCQVDVNGPALLNIVCGAPNAREGIKVAVAMIGAILPNGMEIKRAKLRDVESEGMLCSTQELGIFDDSEGIIELPEDAPLGEDLRQYLDLDDMIFEISITPNRGDCLSVAGIAREIAALNHSVINEPIIHPISAQLSEIKAVNVDCPDACEQYCGRVIKNLMPPVQAPRWLVDRVKRSGTRSISPIVDITNYVLYELGQPLHAFDLETLQGDITVRMANAGETLILLDGQTVTLNPETLIIADEQGPIAMAGIMGGQRTAVTEKTRHIFLESAWFTPTVIAGKARQYGLSTDAAYRFERHVDPTLTQKAMNRAVQLILDICGGDVGLETEVITEDSPTLNNPLLSLHFNNVERLLGIQLIDSDKQDLAQRFKCLGLRVLSQTTDVWQVGIPPHRSDIHLEVDLIEEIARLYGYQRIPSATLKTALTAHARPENKLSIESFCDTLVTRGYHETISYSFVNAEKQALLYPENHVGALSTSRKSSLTLLNPISSECSQMRKGLWPGLLEAASYNQNRQTQDIRLFEFGTRFVIENNVLQEQPILAGIGLGETASFEWSLPSRPYDFYDMKGDVESLLMLDRHQNTSIQFKAAEHPALHPGQTAQIFINNQPVGFIGALHPQLLQHWNLTGPVFLFELDWSELSHTDIPDYQKLSKFPSIRRDISFIVDAAIPVQTILDTILNVSNSSSAQSILHHVQVFDVYQGSQVPAGQKSLAIALTLQHNERTLIESEVTELMEKITAELQNTFQTQFRQV